jgi:glycosyltransferase involved in cell wall biosynthesis
VKLTVVGSGPTEAQIIQWADKAGLGPASYQIIRWLPRNQLLKLYSVSSVFLFPSHEGAGMVVAEAMSYGLPVLCFDNEGPGELIGKNTGIKIPYSTYDNTIEQFANELFSLYRNPEHRLYLSNNAISHFNNYLSWDAKGKTLARIYSEMIKNK